MQLRTSLVCLALAGCAGDPSPHVAFASNVNHPPGVVLMVLSAAPEQQLADGRTRATGYFLGEFYEPHQALVAAGYRIAVATPDGRAPVIDPESLDLKYWNDDPGALARAQALRLPDVESLERARARSQDFQGIVVVGGQGVMVDLLEDPHLHDLLGEFGETHRPIGLICHAPALLTRRPAPRSLAGRRVTSISSIEEWYIETFVMDARAKVRMIGEQLEAAGFAHEAGFPGRSHAVRDCNLVTSQNPFSSGEFGGLFREALADWRRGRSCAVNSGVDDEGA